MPEVSPLPKALAKKPVAGLDDSLIRPQAALLYPALKRAGSEGLAWHTCFELLAGEQERQVGRVVTWMRYQGVEIVAFYEAGETRFRLGS